LVRKSGFIFLQFIIDIPLMQKLLKFRIYLHAYLNELSSAVIGYYHMVVIFKRFNHIRIVIA